MFIFKLDVQIGLEWGYYDWFILVILYVIDFGELKIIVIIERLRIWVIWEMIITFY